jgi:ferrous iron transport protein A
MMVLSSLKTGKIGTVASLKTEDEATLRKLMAMGIMPGIPITLEQRFPSYIIKVGRTRTALDRETAQVIYLQIQDNP